MSIDIVIGSGYGDEGKGHIVDYLTTQTNSQSLVVRFNSGSQAGHTVEVNGVRHVFSHFGSGTLNGSETYLSHYFVANPYLFDKEARELMEKKVIFHRGMVKGHPDILVTTPYDVWLNRKLERMRGDNRHGSVGVGFGETIGRSEESPDTIIDLRFLMLSNDREIVKKLDSIRYEYLPSKIELTKADIDELDRIDKFQFITMVRRMLSILDVVPYDMVRVNDRHIVFEGAQGLLLDQDYGFFPYVTRSNTGMRNVKDIIAKMNVEKEEVDVFYVTRTYQTRHGAGPLANEQQDFRERYNIVDKTNIPNDWQGSLRFAPLDEQLIRSVTDKDFALYAPKNAIKHFAVTCIDQVEHPIVHEASLVSYGPDVNDVRENKEL